MKYYVVEDAEGFAGFFGSTPNDLLSAGIELNFLPRAQSKGLAKLCYKQMFEDIAKLGIPTYLGGTAHPAILHMLPELGRKVTSIVFRKITL